MRSVVLIGFASAGALAVGAVTGCSSSHPSANPPQLSGTPQQTVAALPSISCPATLRATFAKGAAANTVSTQTDVAAGFSTCGYRTTAAKADACTAATVTISTNPQPFKDFQRWVVETGQNSVTGPGLAPIAIMGIGIEADWVPAILTFETATNERWIAVRVTCPASGPQSLSLAEALGRDALAAE